MPANEPGPSTTNPFLQSQGAVILAKYTNEGGVEPDLDILPAITEEAYLETNPEARPARAFQLMCSEGDVDGIVELLSNIDGSSEDDVDALSVLRYQDPLSDMKSGLHLSIEKGQIEVVLLLLWLCSAVPSEAFPDTARQTAETLGVGRLAVDAAGDIRGLKDVHGLTAEHRARQIQGPWLGFLDAGLLTP